MNPFFRKRKILALGLIMIFFIVVLNLFQKEIRSFFYSVSAPIQKVLWKAGDRTSDFLGGLVRINELQNEVNIVKLENKELLAQIAILGELKKENDVLRQALEIELQKEFKLAISQIIGKDISQDFILIDKGSEDGVLKNMSVITQQKVLVGKISETYNNFSKVLLISNKESSFDAKVQEKDISGVVKGKGNFKVSFDLVPREENISQGDIIITSAIGGIFPKGLLVGRIREIKKSDIDPFQKLDIEPFFNIKETKMLFIIYED